MGCNQSCPDHGHSRIFKAKNLNENDKSVRFVYIVVQRSSMIVQTRSGETMANWPMSCIRRYGYNQDGILLVEAGSGCDTGQGVYLFKCEQNKQIFDLVKKFWSELQGDQLSAGHSAISPVPLRTCVTTASAPQPFANNLSTRVPTGGGSDYVNGCVRPPLPTPPNLSPVTRGSTSSHPNALPSLPEETPLSPGSRPFPLQPAPTSRKEMMIRRRINSELPIASYNRDADSVTVAMRPNSVNYENSDVNVAFDDAQPVSYNKDSDQVSLAGPARHPRDGRHHTLEYTSPSSASAGASNVSLRSDCEALLTPNSKSSGVGSLNGNGSAPSNGNPPPIPPPLADPWKRQPTKYKPSKLYGPLSARDYVNTANASMDVSGTPLPATAIGNVHFNFDFEMLGFPRRSGSTGVDRSRLNYVPVDVDFSCGASSASSGIPGTPRTPKTPKTPLLAGTEYAVIDHNKTRALSMSHRARQRERKSRHTSTEVAIANAV